VRVIYFSCQVGGFGLVKMSRNSGNPRDDTPNRINVFLAPSQSSARLPAHVQNQANHPSLNPALFNSPPIRRPSSGDLHGEISQPSPKEMERKDSESQKNLAKQKQKVSRISFIFFLRPTSHIVENFQDQNLILQLDSLGLPDANPVREALRALHQRVTNGRSPISDSLACDNSPIR
jgi:hypothetical protein